MRTEARRMQFLYADGNDAHLMDTESFEQIALPEKPVADELRWMEPAQRGRRAVHRRRARRDRSCPASVDLEVAETEPGLRGDTASGGGTKPATLETGAVIQVPLFVEPGTRIKVDTRCGEYMARA